jgi:N-acetylglutamate synthase-like GNAT family acetyltransferase
MMTERWATEADIPAIAALMARAIDELQKGFLDDDQIAASHAVMGLDTQLIADRTYFVVEEAGRLAGCGGWSWRATLYGGDASQVAREARRLDPAVDAARIRAMYTDPDFTRRGVGARVLAICEGAAAEAGFNRAELMATLSGEPLYRARGYEEIERVVAGTAAGVEVPLIRMGKTLT